jgi:hypothetical protein
VLGRGFERIGVMESSWWGDRLWRSGWTTALIVLVAVGTMRGDDEVDYTQDINPILSRCCATCHGMVKQSNRLG